MAIVTCEECNKTYDDTYRLTYCPHEKFEMSTIVSDGKKTFIATSVDQVEEFFKEKEKCEDSK